MKKKQTPGEKVTIAYFKPLRRDEIKLKELQKQRNDKPIPSITGRSGKPVTMMSEYYF